MTTMILVVTDWFLVYIKGIQQNGLSMIIFMFVATNIYRDKSFVETIVLFYFCRDKHNFVATNVLSGQAYFCGDKRRTLSQQRRLSQVCRDKNDTCGSSRQ